MRSTAARPAPTVNLYTLDWKLYADGCSVARHAPTDTWWSCISKQGHTSYDQLGAAMGMALMILSSRYKDGQEEENTPSLGQRA